MSVVPVQHAQANIAPAGNPVGVSVQVPGSQAPLLTEALLEQHGGGAVATDVAWVAHSAHPEHLDLRVSLASGVETYRFSRTQH